MLVEERIIVVGRYSATWLKRKGPKRGEVSYRRKMIVISVKVSCETDLTVQQNAIREIGRSISVI